MHYYFEKRRRRFKPHAVIASAVGTLVSAVILLSVASPGKLIELVQSTSTSAAMSTGPLATISNRSLPVRLTIAKINVDAATSYVGLRSDGDVDQPKHIADVGWYKYGVLPGNPGSAVIIGHVNGLRGEPGVFKNLNKMRPGDTFSVTDDKNQAATFTVQTSRVYSHDDQPKEVFETNPDSYVNLITCTGSWDATRHMYEERLVVFAKKSS
jgi:LPXTG-site transpeptidase (sortase) family protein